MSGAFAGSTIELAALETVAIIGDSAFAGCMSLKELHVGAQLVSVGESTFAGLAEEVLDIYYGGSEEEFEAIAVSPLNNDAWKVPAHVYYNGSGPRGTEMSPLAQKYARAYLNEYHSDGSWTEEDLYVKGKVASASYNQKYSSWTIWLDSTDKNEGFQIYSAKVEEYLEDVQFAVGDEVWARGKGCIYGSNDPKTYEIGYNSATQESPVIYAYTEAAPVLLSIALDTENVKKSFELGEEPFDCTGLVVTAHFTKGEDIDVTEYAVVTTPDMTTTGDKTVEVSYTDGEVTKTATYQINVYEGEPEPVALGTTMTPGTNGSAAVVNVGDNSFSAVKVGAGSKAGDMTINIGTGEPTKLQFYAAAWNGKAAELTVTVTGATGSVTALSLANNAGIANSSPFTLSGDADPYFIEITFSDVTDFNGVTVKLETTDTANGRFVVWGAQAYGWQVN